jgi:hypothetical protein
MDEHELVQRYLHRQFHHLVRQMHSIFDKHPALAVRMIRSEVELYEKLSRAVTSRKELGTSCDVQELEQLLRDERMDDGG